MSRAVRPPRRLAPGRHGELDQVPAVGDLTNIVQLGTGHHVSAGEGQRRVALQRRVAAYIFDRYNIINEQELLEAGGPAVALTWDGRAPGDRRLITG